MSMPIDRSTYRSGNYNDRPPGTAISSLVLHTTEGAWDSDAEWLCNPASQVSCHYLIDPSGQVYQLVDDRYRAWHAGSGSYMGISDYNSYSIGIEISHMQGRGYGTYQRGAVTDLCRQLLLTYPTITRTYVVMHRQVAPDRKIDPTDISDANFHAWADSLFIPAAAEYRFVHDQAVFTDRRADAPLALGHDDNHFVCYDGDLVTIGDITNGWGWINTGIGFVPMSVLSRA